MHYWDAGTQSWQESRAEIELTRKGAVAVRGQHRAIFSNNANDAAGALDVQLGDGTRLRSSVLALRYYDPVSGQDALLATVQDARGELLPPNQVIYRKVFDKVRADLVYTYRKDGMEADVVLREVPPAPEEFGLPSETTRLEVVTEFFEAPQPVKVRRALATVEDEEVRARVAEPDWMDEELDFGAQRIGAGRAFAWAAREVAAARPDEFAPVGKQWVALPDGRSLLIESAEYVSLLDELLALPGEPRRQEALRERARAWAGKSRESRRGDALAAGGGKGSRRDRDPARVPPRRMAAAPTGGEDTGLLLATEGTAAEPGLVIDWTSLSSAFPDFTFRAGETYHVVGDCAFYGTTTLEGGAVIKFKRFTGAFTGVTISGAFIGKTSAYRPAIFTAEVDNTVGESVLAGVPDPNADYGGIALRFSSLGVPIVVEHVRVKYAQQGICFLGNNPDNTVRHSQFVGCRWTLRNTTASPVKVENVVIDNVKLNGSAFYGASTPFVGQHVTIRNAHSLLAGVTLTLTNSLLVSITNSSAYSGSGNFQTGSGAGIFATAGAGEVYLAPGSPHRNAGVSGLSPELARDLKTLTTEAPVIVGADFTNGTVLGPVVARDTDTPDRGYHYLPLDYVVSGRSLANGSLDLTNGVVLGVYGNSGVRMGQGAKLRSNGTPLNPNRLVSYATVQEQANPAWAPGDTEFGLVELTGGPGPSSPEIRLNYTEASVLADVSARRSLIRGVNTGPFTLVCANGALRGVSLDPDGRVAGGNVTLFNNLLENTTLAVIQSNLVGRFPVAFAARNNLLRAGSLTLASDRLDSPWTFSDNLLDVATLSVSVAGANFSNNGFRAGLTAFGSANKTGLVMDFVASPAGPYTYPLTGGPTSLANLIDAGSRTADAAGLFHHTARMDLLKETNSVVDIGLHYAAPAVSTVGLVGHWRMDEGSGTTASDSSGNGLGATLLNGTAWGTGAMGNALAFDGVNDQASVADSSSLRLTNAFTIALRVKKNGEATSASRLVGKGGSSQRSYGVWEAAGSSGKILLQFTTTNGVLRQLTGNRDLALGRWYHVVCTWDGLTGRIYLDGEQDASGTLEGTPITSNAALTFGYAGYLGAFPGSIDDVQLWDRALAASEVSALQRALGGDADSDGIPDALEDADGDGVVDPGETGPGDLDSDYDGRSDPQEIADGTNPLSAASRKPVQLANWTFDSTGDPWRASNGALPVEQSGVRQVPTGLFLYGLEVSNTTAVLRYRDVELNGAANINTLQGTVRLAYSPYWASSAPNCSGGDAGSGPGVPIDLLSVADFSLTIDARGTNLMLRAPNGAGGVVTVAQAPLAACRDFYPPDFPMDIQVSYGTNASAIFIDGVLVGRGVGIPSMPSAAGRAKGLFFGSKSDRTGQMQGILDSVVTYNVPLNLATNAWVLNAVVNDSPPAVTLTWNALAAGYYRVERRVVGTTAWTLLASVHPPSYVDNTVVEGVEYEYRLSVDTEVPAELFSRTDPEYAVISAGVRLAPEEFPGTVLLVADRSLITNPAFETGVTGLMRDLAAEGWQVSRFNGLRHNDAVWSSNPARIAETKSWITASRNLNPTGVKAVLLLGHVAVPYSGMVSPDGHKHRPLPTDAYYGDTDGVWTDATNWVASTSLESPNLAGDGMFDQEQIPVSASGRADMELAVGRVDFAGLPAFAAGNPAKTEVDLLLQYLNKARAFRRHQVTYPERVVYGAYFNTDPEVDARDRSRLRIIQLASQLEAAIGGTNSGKALGADFFDAQLPSVWAIQGGFGSSNFPTMINSKDFVNDYYGISHTAHQTTDLIAPAGGPPAAFTLLTASLLVQWKDNDHLGRALLAAATNGLAWSYGGAPRVQWRYPVMSLGRTLGNAYLRTQNDAWMWPAEPTTFGAASGTGSRIFSGSPSQGGYIYSSLLGDPTLRQAPFAPPGTLSAITNGLNQLELSWGASPDPTAKYWVYRTSAVGARWTRLTPTPLTGTSFTDTTPPSGSRVYMVRAFGVSTVASGSYTNLSAGSLWP